MCRFCGSSSCDCEARIKSKVEAKVLKCSAKLGVAMGRVAQAELMKATRRREA